MLPQEAEGLLAQANHAILAINRPSGAPHVTPVWYLWDGQAFYISTATDRAKYTHIVHDPAVALIVEDPGSSNYVAAYGRAEIIERADPAFEDLTRRVIGKYLPPDKAGQMLEIALSPQRVVIKLRPERVVVGGKAVALTA